MKGNELSTLIELIRKYNKTGDLSMVEKAYNFAVEKHDGQTRKSGEPFVNHPIQVASIIAEMEFDVELPRCFMTLWRIPTPPERI